MEKSLFERLKMGLERTKKSLFLRLDTIILGDKVIDQKLFAEMEEILISSDIGPTYTDALLDKIKDQVARQGLKEPEMLKKALRDNMTEILKKNDVSPALPQRGVFIIMVVGINGTGKTTSIGKLAHYYKKMGKSVMIAAADTFRAAAIEQLEVWSRRAGASLIKQRMNADPSAVVFDAIHAARNNSTDILIVDTAGRLHTKVNLMEELKKMKRIISKEVPGAPHETFIVLDATTGQNAISQAKMFSEEVGLTGIILTKLDGTAKGGVVVRISAELNIPVRFVGIGEDIDDLERFNSEEFVAALFD